VAKFATLSERPKAKNVSASEGLRSSAPDPAGALPLDPAGGSVSRPPIIGASHLYLRGLQLCNAGTDSDKKARAKKETIRRRKVPNSNLATPLLLRCALGSAANGRRLQSWSLSQDAEIIKTCTQHTSFILWNWEVFADWLTFKRLAIYLCMRWDRNVWPMMHVHLSFL